MRYFLFSIVFKSKYSGVSLFGNMTISNLIFPSNDAILAIINKDHPDYNDVVITGFTEFKSKEDYCNFIGVEKENNDYNLINMFFRSGRNYRDKIHNGNNIHLICSSVIFDEVVNFTVMDGYTRLRDFRWRMKDIVIDDWEFGDYDDNGWTSYMMFINLNNDNQSEIYSQLEQVDKLRERIYIQSDEFVKDTYYLHTSLDRILKLEGTVTKGFFRKEYGVYHIYDLFKGVWSEAIEDGIKDLKRLRKEYIPVLSAVAANLITTNFEDADNVRHIHKIK